MSVGVHMTERRSAEQDSLKAFLADNPDHRGIIHEIAMGAYNQIRYFGIPRNQDCRRMVENAMLLAQVNYTTILIQEDDSLAAIQNRAAAPRPPKNTAPTSVETMDYFMEHFLRYAAAGIETIAHDAAKVAMNDPACGDGYELLSDLFAGQSKTLKAALDTSASAQAQIRREAITDSLRSYAILEVGAQLSRLFDGHDALMERIASAKTRDLKPN